jgi:hypothetical protein
MTTRCRQLKRVIGVLSLACVVVTLLFAGCAKTIHTGHAGEEGATPIVTVHEFPDVPIPKELDLDHKESFVYMTPEFATGSLVYNGNVDYDSLVKFFETSLTNNGWLLQASLKYTRTLLLYEKENRICLINMKMTRLNIRVEIWVAPLESVVYKPFSESAATAPMP